MPKKAITTVGDLREFLTNLMLAVRDGTIDPADASNIVKLAQQVNESFYSEIKVAKIRFDVSGEKFTGLGDMPVGGGGEGASVASGDP